MKPWPDSARKIAVLGGIGLVCLGLFWLFVYQNPFGDKQFNRGLWAAYSGSIGQNIPRCGMYKDLTEGNLKKGMPKQEVLALLGEPDLSKEETKFKYNLGTCSGYSINYSLEIDLDREGKVAAFYRGQY